MKLETRKSELDRYVTAFSPMFNVYVSIDGIHEDDDGFAILTCSSNYGEERFDSMLFRASELTKYCM